MPPPFSAASEQRIFAAAASRNTASSLNEVAFAIVSAAEVAAASAAADSPASRARLCCTAWNFEIFFSNATRSFEYLTLMSSMDSSAPAIWSDRTTPPISMSAVWSNPFGAPLMVMGATLSKVTVSLLSPPRLRPVSILTFDASTSAIEAPAVPLASTAMCFACFAKGTPRARPESVPSAFAVMRSFGPAGAIVISPSGDAIFACESSQPASMVSARGTAIAKRPAAPNTPKPSARLAPEPPQSSATQDSGRPASLSARQSGVFHAPVLSLLMVCASARSAKIFSAVSTTMFSLSATAFPASDRRAPIADAPCCLPCMMGKMIPPDKQGCRYARLRSRHERGPIQFRYAEFRISWADMVQREYKNSERYEETDGKGWIVRDRDRLGFGARACDRRDPGQGRRAHRGQLFQQQG